MSARSLARGLPPHDRRGERGPADAREHQLAVVPSGGRTGLAGGAVAARGELVLSLERMRRMDPVDTLGATVRVQAGAITEACTSTRGARSHLAVDFASKGSSQIGGNIATNAGGVKVIRYGLTRQWVLGLEVVLANGEVLELNGALEKNNTGLDLRQLFIGSEGTLGVVTEATLKLTAPPGTRRLPLRGPRSRRRAAPLPPARSGPFTSRPSRCSPTAASRASRDTAQGAAARGRFALRAARGRGARRGGSRRLAQRSLRGPELVSTARWRSRDSRRRPLGAARGHQREPQRDRPAPQERRRAAHRRARAFAELEALFAARYPDYEICLFGHIGDGNLHVNVMKPDAMSKGRFPRPHARARPPPLRARPRPPRQRERRARHRPPQEGLARLTPAAPPRSISCGGSSRSSIRPGSSILARSSRPSSSMTSFSSGQAKSAMKGPMGCCRQKRLPWSCLRRRRLHSRRGLASFAPHCSDCPLRSQCTDSKAGRHIKVHPREKTLQRSRQRQGEPAWRQRYRSTRPKVERKLSHMMFRRHGGRRARVRGRSRVAHDFAILAAAVNLKRLAVLGVGAVSTLCG
jgi:FAD/FMN-containing dehydrogenase